ncbi:hypothetical protein MITS9509_03534 [Synechococcus sp. MIT S9509]|nr:hypothetical protein MITS9509_03534 [Synechococcus sp. MIT S9509]
MAAAAAAMAVAAVTAVVAEIAGDSCLGAGSDSRLLLQSIQSLITHESTSLQTITHVQWFRVPPFRLKAWDSATQDLPMTMCQIPMKAVQCA